MTSGKLLLADTGLVVATAGPSADVVGGEADAAGVDTASSVAKVRINEPALTLSPNLTLTSLTTPLSGDGTSIDALSDSSVRSGCSALMVSPALTITSMIGTS